MKKIVVLALLISVIMFSCQENTVEPVQDDSISSLETHVFVFSDAEVDKLTKVKFGNVRLNFEQEMEFLNGYVLNEIALTSELALEEDSDTFVKVFCAAGTYLNGVWTFNTATGFTNERVNAIKSAQPETADMMGASASIWIDNNNNNILGDGNDYYDIAYTNPAPPSCGMYEPKANAQSRRMPSGYITLFSYLDCDD